MSKPKAPIQVGVNGMPLSEYFNRVLEDPEYLKEPIHCKLPARLEYKGQSYGQIKFNTLWDTFPTRFYCSCGRKLHHSRKRHAFTRRCKCGVTTLVCKRR